MKCQEAGEIVARAAALFMVDPRCNCRMDLSLNPLPPPPPPEEQRPFLASAAVLLPKDLGGRWTFLWGCGGVLFEALLLALAATSTDDVMMTSAELEESKVEAVVAPVRAAVLSSRELASGCVIWSLQRAGDSRVVPAIEHAKGAIGTGRPLRNHTAVVLQHFSSLHGKGKGGTGVGRSDGVPVITEGETKSCVDDFFQFIVEAAEAIPRHPPTAKAALKRLSAWMKKLGAQSSQTTAVGTKRKRGGPAAPAEPIASDGESASQPITAHRQNLAINFTHYSKLRPFVPSGPHMFLAASADEWRAIPPDAAELARALAVLHNAWAVDGRQGQPAHAGSHVHGVNNAAISTKITYDGASAEVPQLVRLCCHEGEGKGKEGEGTFVAVFDHEHCVLHGPAAAFALSTGMPASIPPPPLER